MKILFVDDNLGMQKDWMSILKTFEPSGGETDVDVVGSADEAMAVIEKKQFDLVVVDAYLTPDISLADSRRVVREARDASIKTNSECLIVVISKVTHIGDSEGTFLREGANWVTWRLQYDQSAPRSANSGPSRFIAECRKRLERLISTKGREDGSLSVMPGELMLQVQVDEIGRETLREFWVQLVGGGAGPVEVSFVWPGHSGAYVFKFQGTDRENRRRTFLIKMSKDKNRLKHELSRAPAKGEDEEKYYVPYVQLGEPDSLGSEGLWFGIAASFEDAPSLRAWLADNNTSAEMIKGALESHFITRAARVNDQETRSWSGSIQDALFTQSRIARVKGAMKMLNCVCRECCTSDQDRPTYNSSLLEEFLETPQFNLGSSASREKMFPQAMLHGDLHGGNILVRQTGEFRLIDSEHRATGIWMADVARLVVDVFVALYDSIPEETQFFWTCFGEWRGRADKLIFSPDKLVDEGVAGVNLRVCLFCQWLLGRVGDIYPKVTVAGRRHDLQLALVIELLRCSYREDLTTPKRVLGLVAAYDALHRMRGGEA